MKNTSDNLAKQFAKYWRNNLADTLLQGGEIKDINSKSLYTRLSKSDWQSGKVSPDIFRDKFKENAQTLGLLVYASIYSRSPSHGQAVNNGIPNHFSTVMVIATVNKDGKLSAERNPYLPRALLEPLEQGDFFIGSMEEYDAFALDKKWSENPEWDELIARSNEIEKALCDTFVLSEFSQSDDVLCSIIDPKVLGANLHIIPVYDLILSNESKLPLFESYATTVSRQDKIIPSPESTIGLRNGHMEPAYPLANAQRDALSVMLSADHGEIIAVNGAPGTGKTTLIQSVIASLWVTAAISRDKSPPVIVAASSNNQAVTNVIVSFGKVDDKVDDPLAGRWLSGIKSYGSYYASSGKEAEATENGYQLEEFMKAMENNGDVVAQRAFYIEQAEKAFNRKFHTSDEIVILLHQELTKLHSFLIDASTKWKKRDELLSKLRQHYGDDPAQSVVALQVKAKTSHDHFKSAEKLARSLNDFVANEPLWVKFLAFIPPIKARRLAQAINFLDLDVMDVTANTVEDLLQTIKSEVHQLKNQAEQEVNNATAALKLMESCNKAQSIWNKVCGTVDLAPDSSFNDFDKAADTQIRQKMFKLAAHYWEGRWLDEAAKLAHDPDNKGVIRMERMWRRRCMVTPCLVSTLYMVPKHFSAWNGSTQKPMYDFIDLLITDESGQVLPSVAGASFALAKRALVVGDTKQLKPVGNCTRNADIGNFCEAGIGIDYEDAEKAGRTVLNGNVMKIAQAACHYYHDKDLDRGLYLYEHRRCVDDIITISNELCYKGKLIPLRGNKQHGTHALPRTGYCHVPGISGKQGKSRFNQLEINCVAGFVSINEKILRAAYPKLPLNKIIAIVTPFASQSKKISDSLENSGHRGITVGTVHKMQGAEFPVVIFSPTYTKHDGAMGMLDNEPNMLNVAVSRAQDSFIVMRV